MISTCPLDEQYASLEKENEVAKALQAKTEKERARLLGAVGTAEPDSKGEEAKTTDIPELENDNVRRRRRLVPKVHVLLCRLVICGGSEFVRGRKRTM